MAYATVERGQIKINLSLTLDEAIVVAKLVGISSGNEESLRVYQALERIIEVKDRYDDVRTEVNGSGHSISVKFMKG